MRPQQGVEQLHLHRCVSEWAIGQLLLGVRTEQLGEIPQFPGDASPHSADMITKCKKYGIKFI